MIQSNGACSVEGSLLDYKRSEGVNCSDSVNSPQPKVQLSPGGSIGSSLQGMKGYGLKKWRRIRREASNEGGSNVDRSRMGKRGLSNSKVNSRIHVFSSAEMKQKSGGSVSSTNAVVRSPGVAVGPVFATRTESENSEDGSSKSSTAASAPKLRHETSKAGGYAGYNNRMKSLNGSDLGKSAAQLGRSRTETSKKPRGERVKIEKEKSQSSVESDSRSSKFVLMQGANSLTSNGRQSGISANYGGENSDKAQAGEQNSGEELQTGFREKMAEFEDVSQDLTWKIKEDNSENHGSSADGDTLGESIATLQSAQEALEKEVQKLREIVEEDIFVSYDLVQDSSLPHEFNSLDPRIDEPNSSDGPSRQNFSNSLESQIVELKLNVNHLQSKLEEARSMLEVKEARVIELEATINNNTTSQQEETNEGKYIEMETELEGFFRQEIESEVEYLAISRTIQKLRLEIVDQITFLQDQKALASEQAQMLSELEDAGKKSGMLKKQAEKLETYCEEIVETDEILKLEKGVCKYTSCFFIQFVLLFVVLVLFVLQLAPHNTGVVVPT